MSDAIQRTAVTSKSEEFPPWVHAMGGSLGSAMALVLLYPLERVRVELQSSLVFANDNNNSDEGNDEDFCLEQDHPGNEDDDNLSVDLSSSHSSLDVFSVDSDQFRRQSTMTKTLLQQQEQQLNEIDSRNTNDDPVGSWQSQKQQHINTIVDCFIRLWKRGELYRGVSPAVITLAISNLIFFWTQSYFRKRKIATFCVQFLSRYHGNRSLGTSWSSLDSLLASTLAGIINVLLTNPLWVANLQIVTGSANKRGLWGEVWHIATSSDGGLQKLWQGTGSSLWLISNPILQFLCYEHIKDTLLHRQQQQHSPSDPNALSNNPLATLSPYAAFWTGAFSKTLSTVLTYPLQQAQAFLRLKQPERRIATTRDCLQHLYHSGGLYTGLQAKLLQTVLTAAFTFLSYEQILRVVALVLVQTPRTSNRDSVRGQ